MRRYQRKGIGLALLKEYVKRLQAAASAGTATYERVLLIAHVDLIPFYEKAGFELIGKSDVVHGPRPWFELRIDLPHPHPSQPSASQLPPGVLEALSRRSGNPSGSKLLSEMDDLLHDVLEADEKQPGRMVNKLALLCPREQCGSLILNSGVASWVERATIQLDPENQLPNPLLLPLPPQPETSNWWLITPNAMVFENIGFTRLGKPSTSGKRLKYLICAECDLGPLGWCEEGGSEFWLACSRVRYRG